MPDPIPLDGLEESSLSTILEKTGEELTDQEIDILIVALRRDRETFMANEASGGKVKKSRVLDKAEVAAKVAAITLDDIIGGGA